MVNQHDELYTAESDNCQEATQAPSQPIATPMLWMPHPARVNSLLWHLRENSETWARGMGMLADDEPPARGEIWRLPEFRAMSADYLTALAVPDASLAGLQFTHRLNLWCLAWDDYFAAAFKQPGDLPGARAFTDRLHAFLPSTLESLTPTPINAVERGLVDLQKLLLRSPWAHMHEELCQALRRYIDAGVQELLNNLAGRVPDIIEYAQLRRETFAAYSAPNTVTIATGGWIPESVLHTSTIAALLDAFMDHMGFVNDIVSYEREVNEERDVNNLVVVLQRWLGITLQKAACAATELTNTRIRYFDHLALVELPPLIRRVEPDPDERTALETWLQGARSFLSGLCTWHTSVPRYPAGGADPTIASR